MNGWDGAAVPVRDAVPPAGGGMGALIRAHDWAATPLGSIEGWPQSLKVAVRLLLNSRHPMFIWWGPELIQFYNDAYAESLGPEKHPAALGARGRDTWAEAWDVIGPQIDQVMRGGEATWHEDQLVPIVRHGGRADVWWTYGMSPIDEPGAPHGVGGVLVIVRETSAEVLARRDADERYRALFDAIDCGFCIVEVDLAAAGGRIDYRVAEANPAFHRQTGFPPQVLGRWLREAAPDLEEHWYDVYGRVARTGVAERFEQGSESLGRWFDVYAFPVGAGASGRVAILFNDISERRRAELAVRELNATLERRVADALAERQVFAQVVENATAAVTALDRDGRVLAINGVNADAFERGFGRRPAVGDHLLDLLADMPEHQAQLRALWARALGGERFAVTREFGDRELERRAFEVRFDPLRDRDGGLVGASSISYDVTERLRAQAELAAAEAARREADALYRAYFENTAEALFIIGVEADGGFRVEEINPAHAAATGLDLQAIRGRRLDEEHGGEVVRAVTANYRRVVAERRPISYREAVHFPLGLRRFDTVLVPVAGADGAVRRIIGSSRDVTARVAAEEALRQSQKMEAISSLTGGVAHDFNNLLSPIIGGMDLLQRWGVGDERARRTIAGALQSAERAKTLVQRLLAFARRQPLQPAPVDLGALVEGMADLVASTVGPTVRVEVAVEPGLPPALADANQVEMALLNLAVNARDAMPDGGALSIAAAAEQAGSDHRAGLRPGRYLRLGVADTGVGMDQETLARAAEPFFSTKGVGKGTGLGLSMVHGLAAQLGGGLAIRSRPGEGTAVELWLPVTDAAAPPDRPEAEAAATPPAGVALVVDDEELVRASTAAMLGELGWAVAQASSGEAALRAMDGGLSPDLVVTDHLMPGMSGADLARAVRERAPHARVLVVSGYAELGGVAPDLARLTKPFRQADLAAAIARADA